MVLIAAMVVCSLLIAGEEKKANEAPHELKQWQGRWRVLRAERDGEVLSEDRLKTLLVICTGDKIVIRDGKNEDVATILVNPTAKPATVDFKPTDDERVALGIYAWEGMKLKICWGKAGGPRPTEFSSKADRESVVFVLEREKP